MGGRADDFQQAFRNLQLQPLISEQDTRKFHVPYGEDLIPELEQLILDCTEANNQLIFAGHRGCGKTTLLARFFNQIKGDFFTVFFSISDLIEHSEIDHVTILFVMALELMEEAERQQIQIPQDKIQSFYNWFAKRTLTEINTLASAEVSAGFSFFDVIKGKIKTDATLRETITKEFKRSFRELVETINVLAIEIKLACAKEIVVIIDDIDKLDLEQIEEIFQRNIKALLEPRFIVIYTIPIATIRDGGLKKQIEDETGNLIFLMPVEKLFDQGAHRQTDPQPLRSTLQILSQVLFKRVQPELMAEGIVDRIVVSSGGVLREVIRIAQECCRLVRVDILKRLRRQESVEEIQIDDGVLDQALENLRNGMAITLSKTDRMILKTVYEYDVPEDPKQQEFLDLLHTIYVVEYRNGSSWYGLHPLIAEQLHQEGVI